MLMLFLKTLNQLILKCVMSHHQPGAGTSYLSGTTERSVQLYSDRIAHRIHMYLSYDRQASQSRSCACPFYPIK